MAIMHVTAPAIVTALQPNCSLSDVLSGEEKYTIAAGRELTQAVDGNFEH